MRNGNSFSSWILGTTTIKNDDLKRSERSERSERLERAELSGRKTASEWRREAWVRKRKPAKDSQLKAKEDQREEERRSKRMSRDTVESRGTVESRDTVEYVQTAGEIDPR